MRRALALTATMLAAGSIATGTARAGSYQVTTCTGATPLVNDAWQPFNNNASYLEIGSNCGSSPVTGGSSATSGLAAADVLRLTTNVPSGALAGWRFDAPPGATISAITMDRDLYEQSEGWDPQVVDAEGVPLAGETCPFNAGAGGCEHSGISTQTGLDTPSVAIELLCDPGPAQLSACANGFSEHDARIELNGATVTIEDQQAPHITTTSGTLFAAGLAHGVLSGTVEGSDNSGVQYVRLYVDGTQLAQQSNSCDFSQPAPCPSTSSNQFSLNTSTLSSGPHAIQVALIDAAGNQALTAPVQITVDNTAPSAPSWLQVNSQASGIWINRPATISWSNPSQPADDPISQVNWIACAGSETSIPASGCEAEQHQSSPVGYFTFNPDQYPAFASHPQGVYTVFVWLQDAIGNTSPTNSASLSFGYQTSPPPPPTSIKVSGSGPYTITLGAPADLAPLTTSHWTACNSVGACTPPQTSAGLSFRFAPSQVPQFERSPFGRYTIRAWLQDAAGNTSPVNSATVTINHARPGKPSPQIRILHVTRTGVWLRVRGSADRAVAGDVTVVAGYTLDRRSHAVQMTVRVGEGKWAGALRLPQGAHADRVTVVRHTSAHWRAQTVTRYVHHPSTSG
jgi:hypothetical protein